MKTHTLKIHVLNWIGYVASGVVVVAISLLLFWGLGAGTMAVISVVNKSISQVQSWYNYHAAVAEASSVRQLDLYRKLASIRIAEANQARRFLIDYKKGHADKPECVNLVQKVWAEELGQAQICLEDYQRKANSWNAYAYRALGVLGGDPSAFGYYQNMRHDTDGIEELQTDLDS